MTNELTTLNNMTYEQIAELTGAYVKTTIFPRLIVNRDPEDEKGNKLDMGSFCISQNENNIYSKTATFRTYINSYQYAEFDQAAKTFTNKSIIIKSFKEEALDMKGGVACGKIPFKQLQEASLEVQNQQKSIKCRRHMYGTVTLHTPKLADGTPVVDTESYTDVPVLFKLAGGNFMAPKEAFDTIDKLRHAYFQHSLELSTKRRKVGSVWVFDIEVTPNLKEMLTLSDNDMLIFKDFQDAIAKENSVVLTEWRKSKKQAIDDIDVMRELDLNDDISDL